MKGPSDGALKQGVQLWQKMEAPTNALKHFFLPHITCKRVIKVVLVGLATEPPRYGGPLCSSPNASSKIHSSTCQINHSQQPTDSHRYHSPSLRVLRALGLSTRIVQAAHSLIFNYHDWSSSSGSRRLQACEPLEPPCGNLVQVCICGSSVG
jgi:hypothetical protein